MSNRHDNLTEADERIAREQAQAHPPSWAALYGDDLGPSAFEDAGPSYHPDEKSSAAKHTRGVRAREQRAAQRRDLAVIGRAADEQSDDLALEQATDRLRNGQDVPMALRIRAARAANRQGTSVPSAELLAANARS